jgi:hypothetical protein
MGFFEGLTGQLDKQSLGDAFSRGANYKQLLAEHQFQKSVKEREMAIADKELAIRQNEYDIKKAEADLALKNAENKTKMSDYINKRLTVTNDLKSGKKPKAAMVDAFAAKSPEDFTYLADLAASVGSNDLATNLQKRGVKMEPTELEKSQTAENIANTQRLKMTPVGGNGQQTDFSRAIKGFTELSSKTNLNPVDKQLLGAYTKFLKLDNSLTTPQVNAVLKVVLNEQKSSDDENFDMGESFARNAKMLFDTGTLAPADTTGKGKWDFLKVK